LLAARTAARTEIITRDYQGVGSLTLPIGINKGSIDCSLYS
jgi:hypothetical protein